MEELYWAVSKDDVEQVKKIINIQENICLKPSSEWPIEHPFLIAKSDEMVKLLLKAGSDPNIENIWGNTLLHTTSSIEVINLL